MPLTSAFALLLFVSSVQAGDTVNCLARIAYAEAQGESLEGITVLMFTALKHAERSKKNVCAIPAKQKAVPKELHGAYVVLAEGVLSGRIKDTSKGSDSWQSSKDAPKRGKITRKIKRHWFVNALGPTP